MSQQGPWEENGKVSQGLREDYEHIADRMLRQLEDEYEQVHKYNQQKEDEAGDEEEPPEGYENLDNADGLCDNGLDSDSQEEVENENESEPHMQIPIIPALDQGKEAIKNPQSMELIEVGPVPETVFAVPAAEECRMDKAQSEKIKLVALTFDIETPQWAKDPAQLEERIRKLFQSPLGSKIGEKAK